MNKPQSKTASLSQERHERLWQLYSLLVQLVMHEGILILERTNILLICNSIFFAGFLLLTTQVGDFNIWIFILKMALSLIGVMTSVFHYIIIGYTRQAINFWRDRLFQIESDPDFWYPTKVDNDVNLNIFQARRKSRKFIPYFLPNDIYNYWLPLLISILWSLAFCWSIVDYLSRIN